MDTITFTLHNGANVEHYAATTPEGAVSLRDAFNGSQCGWTFEKMSEGYWHVHTGPEITLGQIPRVASRQFLGSATLTSAPAGMVIFEGVYMSPSEAMFCAGY